MIEFIIGQAGSGRTTELFRRIRDFEIHDRQVVIVPEQFSYESDRALYGYLGAPAFNELLSLSFTSLSRQLFQLYGDPNRSSEYADDLARMILVYQAISSAQKQPGGIRYFTRQSSCSGFAEEILTLIGDLKRSGITPDDLRRRSALLDRRLMDKTCDIAAVYTEYERLMNEYGFKDELDNIREAAAVANTHGYFRGREVYLDSFESFTGDQLEMLRVMLADADNVYITLCTDDVDAGEFTLFETVNSTYRRIASICRELGRPVKVTACGESFRFRNPELAYLSSHIMRPFVKPKDSAPAAENISIFEARDMYGEAEYVCAAIKRLIHADSTLHFRDIAIVSNNIEQYGDVLKAAFVRYDIPYFLSVSRPVMHTSVMVFFTSLLDIVTSRRLRTEQIFRLLKSGLTDIPLTDISLLENYCLKWGIDGDMWSSPFTAPDDELSRIEQLRKRAVTPLLKLRSRLSHKCSAVIICGLLYDAVIESCAGESVCRIMNELIRSDRSHDAAELKRLWGCMTDILDSIADTLGEREMSVSEISRIIRSMIHRIEYSVPPQTLDSVIAAPARTARLSAPRVVFIMGVSEGDFPSKVSVHGLLSESDKQKLFESGIEISRPLPELIAAERLVVYKALSCASERLYLTYPLADLSGQAKYPSQLIESVKSMLGNSILVTEDAVSPAFYAVTMNSAFYRYMQERSRRDSAVESIKDLLMSDKEYSRRMAYVLTRSDHEQDFRIDMSVMERLRSFTPLYLSSTGIEEYDLCHFKFFCDKCMDLHKNETVDLDARAAGELTHECFYGILSSRTKEDFIGMSYDDLRSEIRSRAEAYRENRLAGEFGKSPKFELIFNKLTERLTNVFVHAQQELMATSFTPRRFEYNTREDKPLILSFGDGFSLSFGGVIDRIDTCEIDGVPHVRVIDYKSGRKKITAEHLAAGIDLQMLLYLFSVTEKGGAFEGHTPAGVLYSPIQISDIGLDKARGETLNDAGIDTSLRTKGLMIDDPKVLEAMEKGLNGRFIAPKLKADGGMTGMSECMPKDSVGALREYVYGRLRDMASSLKSGNADAVPLFIDNRLPCRYCDYINICDNSQLTRSRTVPPEDIAEAERILGQADGKEGEADGMD